MNALRWTRQQLDAWVAALAAGKVTVAPAEGVYGYCADPASSTALGSLDKLKQRPPDKSGYLVLLPDVGWIEKIWGAVPEQEAEAIQKYFPCPAEAPVSLVLQNNPAAEQYFAAYLEHFVVPPTGVAVRVPACVYMQAYLRAWGGPLISTSANVSGRPPAQLAEQLPVSRTKLTLEAPLDGRVSRLYNPKTGQWYR
jgi:L-threonylcarbamoyladenylate synthase